MRQKILSRPNKKYRDMNKSAREEIISLITFKKLIVAHTIMELLLGGDLKENNFGVWKHVTS
jgi:hypothetical protein